MATISKIQTRKDGSRFFRISVSRGHGESPYSTRWNVPDGLAAATVKKRLTAFAEDFERRCRAGEIMTRKQQKELEESQEAAEQVKNEKTFRWFCENQFMNS